MASGNHTLAFKSLVIQAILAQRNSFKSDVRAVSWIHTTLPADNLEASSCVLPVLAISMGCSVIVLPSASWTDSVQHNEVRNTVVQIYCQSEIKLGSGL